MSCRRVSRELLERFRFGDELDWQSDPHLKHLESCDTCREEVGIDLALVSQLRKALRARVDGHAPSSSSWQTVRSRALAAESAPSWSSRVLRWARVAPAAVAMGLMIIAVTMARESDRPVSLQPVTWPGFQERASDAPGPQLPLTLRYSAAPEPSTPPTGLTAFADPNRPLRSAPPESGLLP